MKPHFELQGTEVTLAALLELKMLAFDLRKLSAQKVHSKRLGEQRSPFRGQGREFIEMKHYLPGDDVRQIDWRQTAKKQTPFVRVMEEDRHSEQVIWLELTASCYFGTQRVLKSVVACYWAAFLVWRLLQFKHPTRLYIRVGDWQQEIKLTHQRQAPLACQLIVDAHLQLAKNFRNLPESNKPNLNHWRGQPTLWFISDFREQTIEQLKSTIPAGLISSANFLQILDPFDLHLPSAGSLPVKKDNQQGWIETDDVQHQK